MNHQVHGIEFTYSKSKRRTVSLFVERDGSVSLIVPEDLELSDIEKIVEKKQAWIYKSLAEWKDLNASRVEREFVSGEAFLYLGRSYKLRVSNDLKSDLTLKNGQFLIRENKLSQCAEIFKSFYIKKGLEIVRKRIDYYQGKIGVKANDIRVRELGNRWASCTSDGNLNFHWKCVMAPLSIVDYIVVHELCHLHQLNHNDAFWNEVDKVLPDYRKRKEWLKNNGAALDFSILNKPY